MFDLWMNEGTKIVKEIIDQSRWSTSRTKVVKQLSTGKHFRIYWDRGSTECQDGEEMFYDDPVELPEVHLVEKVVQVWESVNEVI